MAEIAANVGSQIALLLSRHNQPSTEHGQAAIATALLAIAESIDGLAAAHREVGGAGGSDA